MAAAVVVSMMMAAAIAGVCIYIANVTIHRERLSAFLSCFFLEKSLTFQGFLLY